MKRTQKEAHQEIKRLRGRLKDKELFLSEPYHHAILKLVQSLAQKSDVSLVLDYKEEEKADLAFTNGTMVYINTANFITRKLKSREEKVESHEGFAARECGHIRCTDFNRRTVYVNGFSQWRVYPKPPAVYTVTDKKAWNELKGYLEAHDEIAASVIARTASYLSNLLEDVYIENFMCQKYPGSVRKSIQRNASYLIADIPTEIDRKMEKASGLTIMMDMIFRYARAGKTEMESNYSKQYQICLNRCRNIIDEATVSDDTDIRYYATNRLMIVIWKYLKKTIESTTQDLEQVTNQRTKEELKNKVKEYLEKKMLWVVLSDNENDSIRFGVLKDDMKGWDGQLNNCDNESERRQETIAESSKEQLERFRREEKTIPAESEENTGNQTGDAWDLFEDLPELLNEAAKEKYIRNEEKNLRKFLEDDLNNLQIGEIHKGCEVEFHRMVGIPPDAIKEYDLLAPEIKRIARKLQESIEEILRKQEGGTLDGLYMGKRLSRGNLYRQDGKIFEKRFIPGEGFSIAIAVLMDNSDSMRIDDRIGFAKKTALGLYEFCCKLEIPIMVYGHTTHNVYTPDGFADEVVDIYAYADFDSVDQQDHLRIVKAETGFCNRDGVALRFVGERLLKREEEIKLLISISDGQPNARGYRGETAKLDLQEIKRNLERQGEKLFVAAIGDDKQRIEDIYGDGFLNITDLNTMPRKLAGLLTEYIG